MNSKQQRNNQGLANYLLILLVVIMYAVMVQSVNAQWVGSIADPALPLIPNDLIDSMGRRLQLSDTQQTEINSVIERFSVQQKKLIQTSFELSLEDGKLGKQEWERSKNGEPVVQSVADRRMVIFKKQLSMADQIAAMKEQTLSDIKLLLTPDQAEAWEQLLRDRRRKLTINRDATFIGEGVDLLVCLDEANVSNLELAPIRKRYAEDLDPLLIKRNQIRVEDLRKYYQQHLDGTLGKGDPRIYAIMDSVHSAEDIPRANRQLEELGVILRKKELQRERPTHQSALQVRRLNLQYLDEFKQHLTLTDQQRLMKVYQKDAYSSYPIFFPLEADRYIEGLINDKTLDEKTRAEITRIRDENYLPQRDQLNLALAGAYERRELRWEQRILGTLDPSYENRIKQLHNQRRTLQQQTIRDITPLLSEDTLKKYPAPESIKDKPRL